LKPALPGFALFCLLGAAVPLTAQNPLPTDVTILTQNDFKARNVFSVGDALRGVPSLKIEQDGSRGTRMLVKMRGFSSSNDVLVLLDGRPLTHEYDSIVDVSQFPLSMVDRIEITRGGASLAMTAEAVAGTINIITLRPHQKGLLVDMGTGIGRNGEKNSAGKITGRSNLGDITYAPSVESSGGFSNNEDFDTTNHFGNFTRSFNGKGYWGGEYYYHDSRVGVSNGTPVPLAQWNGNMEQQAATPDLERTQVSQHAKAFLAVPLLYGGTTYASFTDSWRNSQDLPYRGGPASRDEDSRASTFDLSWRRSAIETGLRAQRFERKLFGEDAHDAMESGVYAVGKWRAGKLTVAPGLRYDRHSVSGGFLAPRIALIYAAGDSFSVSASAQRAHRVPSFEELYFSSAVLQNPNLKDEKSVNTDMGLEWKPGAACDFKTTGFYIRKTNLIAPDASSTWANGGEEHSHGIETEASLQWGEHDETKNIFSVNWTAQKSRRSLPTAPAMADSAMSPRHLVDVKWDKHMPRSMTFSNELRYQSEQFELDGGQGVRIPGFYVWNARFSLRILAADMYFAIDNIARRRYAETTGQNPLSGGGTATVLSPQPDRTFWTGVSIRFLN